MQALGDLRPASSLAVKILIAALHDPVLDVRLAAIRALGNIGDKATIALSELNQQAREKEDPLNVEAKLAIEKIKAAAEAKGRPLY
jgi:HEAT repeat protein